MSSTQLGSIDRICPLGYFGFGGIEKFCAQKLGKENLSQFTKMLNYIKFPEIFAKVDLLLVRKIENRKNR